MTGASIRMARESAAERQLAPSPNRKNRSAPARENHTRRRLQGTMGNQAVLQLLGKRPEGHPLPHDLRRRFEPRFGQDLGGIRIHRNGSAAQSAQSMGALAYTLGRDIVFAEGQYQPGTLVGDRILAHEIAHALQQRRAAPPRDGVLLGVGSDRDEAEAHRASRAVMLGRPAVVTPAPSLHVVRLARPEETVAAPERSWASAMSDRFLADQLRRLDDSQAQFSQSLRNLAAGLPPAQFAQVDAAIGVVDAIIDTFQSIGMFLTGIEAGTVELLIDMVVGLAKLALFVIELLGRFLSDLIAFLLQQAGVDIHLPGQSGREFALNALAAIEKLPAAIRASFEAWQARYRAAPPELKAAMLGRLFPQVVATLFAGVGAARAAVAGGRALLATSTGRALTVSLPLSLARVEAQILAPSGMMMEARAASSVAGAQSLMAPASTLPAALSTPAAAAPLAAAEAAAIAPVASMAAPVASTAAPLASAAAPTLTTPQLMSLAYMASLAPTSTIWTAPQATALQSAAQSVQPPATQAPNVLAETTRAQHGPFSVPQMWGRLRTLLIDMRSLSGIRRETKSVVTPDVERSLGGNMAVSLTSVAGVRNGGLVVGRSPEAGGRAQLGSQFSPSTDPVELPHTHRHAEQELAERLWAAMGGMNPAAWQGQTVWILVDAVPCAQGMNDVLPALSAAFPGLAIEVKTLEHSHIIRYRDGVLLNR